MQQVLEIPFAPLAMEPKRGGHFSPKDSFRVQFKKAMRRALKSGRTVEQAFGDIWDQTLEVIRLDEKDHSELFGELIAWARDLI